MPRAKQRTPALRDHLLEVAISTLSEEGIARFTTRRVAERAGTSVPAVYELFDDKAGLVRAMFFEGFRLLGGELAKVPLTDDPLGDLEQLVPVFRLFCRAYPRLAQVMFSRPFADFEPGPDELAPFDRRPGGHRARIACAGTGFGGSGGGAMARVGAGYRAAVEAGGHVAADRIPPVLTPAYSLPCAALI
jgi:AcrR family transcriptional regulator